MTDYPEGTMLIEIRGLYDGWSVAKLPSGELVNRWSPDHWLHAKVQEWIDSQKEPQCPKTAERLLIVPTPNEHKAM